MGSLPVPHHRVCYPGPTVSAAWLPEAAGTPGASLAPAEVSVLLGYHVRPPWVSIHPWAQRRSQSAAHALAWAVTCLAALTTGCYARIEMKPLHLGNT